jgi:tetratricopeptide (TPR) repeat protein
MKRFVLIACVAALLAPVAAHAELQLWISYHFQGVDAYEAGKYRDAEALLTKAHTETCDEYRLAFTMDSAGQTHMALGEYPEAEKCLNAALCLRDADECGESSRFVPATLNNLADLHYIAGNKDKVECLYRRALDMNKRDSYSVEVGRSLNGLALVAADAGNATEAENLLKRAVKVHFMGGRSEHPYMATALVNLGILYTEQGRYAEAKDSLLKAKHIQDEALGCNHPDVAIRLHAEANLLAKSGCAEAARTAQEKANKIQESFAKLNAKQG